MVFGMFGLSAADRFVGPAEYSAMREDGSVEDPSELALDREGQWDPLVGPQDDKFKAKKREFDEMLRDPNMVLSKILDGNFSPHERLIFTPANHPRSLVKVQKDNTARYRKLLEGRFASESSSISLKLTMLWFGLPVEPMLKDVVGLQNEDTDSNWEDDEDVELIEVRPPLHFLTAHEQRNWGMDNLRGKSATGLGLRMV